MDVSKHLWKKPVNILITNICNLSCGGCSQQCGYIPKQKLWNINLDQLRWNIDLLTDARKGNLRMVGLFGGEPTLHPEYESVLEITKNYPKTRFVVFTNGRDLKKTNLRGYKNVSWKIDFKDKNSERGGCGQLFLPTQVAAMDVLKNTNKRFYWEKAQNHCKMWNSCWCIIYNNMAYFCEIAASFDLMHDGYNGWPLQWGVDPFARSPKEINTQADNFCYRCGWCLTHKELEKAKIPTQLVKDPSIVSHINIKIKYKTKKPIVKVKNNSAKIFM
jgi:hypothetical protein